MLIEYNLGFTILIQFICSFIAFSLARNSYYLIFAQVIPLYVAFKSLIHMSLHQSTQLFNGYSFYQLHSWIDFAKINIELGVDELSIPLMLLSIVSVGLCLFYTNYISVEKEKTTSAFLFLLGSLLGLFSSIDLVTFFIFFEATLIPMLFLIGQLGGTEKSYAAIKFFLYTFSGSVLILLAILYLGSLSSAILSLDKPYSMMNFPSLLLSQNQQLFLFILMALGFAIKIPMVPFHTWLPHAHVQAPTTGSVVLAAVLLKIGGYGFFRIVLPLCPDALIVVSPIMIGLSLIAIVYVGWLAVSQKDLKKMIAYSSIAHMGFVSLGLFLLPEFAQLHDKKSFLLSFNGAYFEMISHGLISAALFFSVGIIYQRAHTRNFKELGGIGNFMPIFCGLFVFLGMANCGLPGTSGFIGEAFVLIAAFQIHPYVSLVAGLSFVFSAAYSLLMVKKVLFGPSTHLKNENFNDCQWQESFILILLVVSIILLGVQPSFITKGLDQAGEKLYDSLAN